MSLKLRKSSTFTLSQPQTSCTPQLHWDPFQITLAFTHFASGTYKTSTSYLSSTDSSLYTGIWREREPNLKKQSKYSRENIENGAKFKGLTNY